MPESSSIWLIASPLDGEPSETLGELAAKVDPSGSAARHKEAGLTERNSLARVGSITMPEFKTGTLSSLLSLSEACVRHDANLQSIVNKIVDTLASLDPDSLDQHLVVDDGRPWEAYIMEDWRWNRAKYRAEGRDLTELVDEFIKDFTSIDGVHKQKLGDYNLAKGQLQQMQRKRTGNLATRDLTTVIDRESANDAVRDSEYLETVYVAVPKNLVKQFEQKYERFASMVVPRSATQVAKDDEFVLYAVTVFRRVKDEFSQKCREDKFQVRDFTYNSTAAEKQRAELEQLEQAERDQWAEMIRLSRINFSEALQILVHLKVVRAFAECVLRYGLPAHYFSCAVKPEPKQGKKLVSTLGGFFEGFCPPPPDDRSAKKTKKQDSNDSDALMGEFQTVMDQELYRFVLYEIPKIEANRESN